MDVVLSEYLNKSHNFTNFIFYDVTLRYSIVPAVAVMAGALDFTVCYDPTKVYISTLRIV